MGLGAASVEEEMKGMIKRRRKRSLSQAGRLEKSPVPNITEIYGFAIFSFTIISYGIFILWAFIPEEILHYLGVSYYPSKYWAIALPSYMIFSGLLGLLGYVAMCLIKTPPLDSFSTFTDTHARKPRDRSQRKNLGGHGKVPAVSDLPLSVINKLFHSTRVWKRKRQYDS